MLKSFAAVSAGLIGGANAFWRMECPGRVGLARIDPIVDPGMISAHAHSIHGSSAFAETVTSESLNAGDCTSCRVTQDKSSYWHPALYFKDGNTGEYELVDQVGGMLAYYLLNGENITAFPPNFRMLTGNSKRRTYTAGDPNQPDPDKSEWESLGQTGQETLAQRALGFNCLNYGKTPESTLYRHYLPEKSYLDANCKDGVRFEIMFPSCWKGGDNLDSDDHQSHVAFPDLVMTGTCPDDYPVRLPSLMYEVIWDTASYSGRNGEFVIANGDKTGYGYHADFITGWDEAFLQSAVDTCTSDTGRIQDCPLFDVVTEEKAEECEMTVPILLSLEDVKGPMIQLPGDVQISFGGGDSAQGSSVVSETPTASGVAMPTLTYTPGVTPSNLASLPGQISKQTTDSGVSTSTSSSTSATIAVAAAGYPDNGLGLQAFTTPSTPSTTPTPSTSSMSYYSTEYITNGDIVTEILWEEETAYVTSLEDITVVVTVTSTALVGPPTPKVRRRGFAHGHGHRHN